LEKEKAEKAQAFSAAAESSKQEYSSSDEDEDDKGKKAFMKKIGLLEIISKRQEKPGK
jgi:hypothetical protein